MLLKYLGSPNSEAENYRVEFIDYIKNVASSEIYPTWPAASLESNIYAQISFALNRIYTEWYRSKGYPFDITNSTAYDQYFVKNREIYQPISVIVDRIFNVYIRRAGHREPFFAQFCNGTTVTCAGLSQWGTVDHAKRGLTPIQILKQYYPSDIELVSSNVFRTPYESYPGSPLRQGSTGANVLRMQNYLNRIRTDYPLIPQVTPDGVFGSGTANAVRTFQSIFTLAPDGIIGRATWNRISSIYVGVRKLADMGSEGHRIGIGNTPPNTTIKLGARGRYVVQLQYILNSIAQYYPEIPFVLDNSLFDSITNTSVLAFQRHFGLTPDGIVGPGTWRKLYDVYLGIQDNVPVPDDPEQDLPPFPGTALRYGSRGTDVLIMQTYLSRLSAVYPSIPEITADGIFGARTQAAVIAFQKLFGLTADGVIGALTWNRIIAQYNSMGSSSGYPGTPLRPGSTGDAVALMQRYLNRLSTIHPSIPSITADGVFGSQTQSAVKAFQQIFGLTPDGIIGPATWAAIVREYNKTSGTYSTQSQEVIDGNQNFNRVAGMLLLSKIFGGF